MSEQDERTQRLGMCPKKLRRHRKTDAKIVWVGEGKVEARCKHCGEYFLTVDIAKDILKES